MNRLSGRGRGEVFEATHYWRVRTVHPEWKGRPCRVLCRLALNSCVIEFADGLRVVTSRWYVRELEGKP